MEKPPGGEGGRGMTGSELEARARRIFEDDPPECVECDTWDTLKKRNTEWDREIIESYFRAAKGEQV